MLSGIALVDKPLGMSSHDVVSRARKALGTKKVGHAGTLDPQASGLLVLGVGTGTRLLTYCVGLGKTYQATLRLGYGTSTDDAEGERLEVTGGELSAVNDGALDEVIQSYVGDIMQVPSTYSAIKVDGRRAYDLARSGQEVSLVSRPVTVYRIDRGNVHRAGEHIDVELLIECSSGTYIRALARDIGATLGVGGHLVALRRTVVGPFSLENATPSADLTPSHVMPLAEAASTVLARVEVSGAQSDDLSHGRAISTSNWPTGQPLAAIDSATGHLVAIVESSAGRSRILMGVPDQA